MTIQATFTTLTLAASILSGSWTLASPEPTAGAPIVAVPSPMMWQDPAGTPLPFQNDSEVLEFLRTARVVSQKSVGVGVNEISKVLLEKDGVQLHAAFRKVSVFEPRMTMDNGDIKRNYRDDCRSFGNSKEIRFAQFIQWCRRDLWENLQELDREVLKKECKGLLSGGQIKALMARRDLLVGHIQKLIDEKGEGTVLFADLGNR